MARGRCCPQDVLVPGSGGSGDAAQLHNTIFRLQFTQPQTVPSTWERPDRECRRKICRMQNGRKRPQLARTTQIRILRLAQATSKPPEPHPGTSGLPAGSLHASLKLPSSSPHAPLRLPPSHLHATSRRHQSRGQGRTQNAECRMPGTVTAANYLQGGIRGKALWKRVAWAMLLGCPGGQATVNRAACGPGGVAGWRASRPAKAKPGSSAPRWPGKYVLQFRTIRCEMHSIRYWCLHNYYNKCK